MAVCTCEGSESGLAVFLLCKWTRISKTQVYRSRVLFCASQRSQRSCAVFLIGQGTWIPHLSMFGLGMYFRTVESGVSRSAAILFCKWAWKALPCMFRLQMSPHTPYFAKGSHTAIFPRHWAWEFPILRPRENTFTVCRDRVGRGTILCPECLSAVELFVVRAREALESVRFANRTAKMS